MQIAALSGWTSQQKHVVAASFLGWTLDAFDFFLMVFVLKDIAQEFHTDVTQVTIAILLTLATRPVGAFLFGRAADRWGRRPTLMVDVLFYSAIEFASGFAPNLTALLILRAIYGIAMGGEWGVGASLTMESIPPQARGFVSGLLQSGYPTGYFLASIVYGLLFQYIGWRGMFMVGVIPALLVLYIRRHVPESPSWKPTDHSNTLSVLRSHWRLGIYAVLLMTAFNFFSHGTQDHGRDFVRLAVGTFRPQANHHHRSRAVARGVTAMGLCRDRGMAGGRSFLNAGHGPGSLGSRSSSSQRAVARRGARYISRFHLPAGQSDRFGQRDLAGGNRGA
jgi:MFS family permease